jgi:hypothetical protein
MTPLAYRIVKDMTLPVKRRTFKDHLVNGHAPLLPHFRQEFHCFEVTQVKGEAEALKSQMLGAAFPSVTWSFLPAERTWIEWQDHEGGRLGAMLVRKGEWADVWLAALPRTESICSAGYTGRMAMSGALSKIGPLGWQTIENAIFTELSTRVPYDARPRSEGDAETLFWQLYTYLLLINTPKIVSRTTRDPHRGLARDILARRKLLGIFPLQAWTEITLSTDIIFDDSDHAASGLTGAKCFHWTRAHKRRVHGIWTLIHDYWAGDGSLGIKQSRYKVVPGDEERAP